MKKEFPTEYRCTSCNHDILEIFELRTIPTRPGYVRAEVHSVGHVCSWCRQKHPDFEQTKDEERLEGIRHELLLKKHTNQRMVTEEFKENGLHLLPHQVVYLEPWIEWSRSTIEDPRCAGEEVVVTVEASQDAKKFTIPKRILGLV